MGNRAHDACAVMETKHTVDTLDPTLTGTVVVSADGPEHHIVADNGAFDSGVLQPDQSFTFIFDTAGSFGYHDALDPSIKGTITVE